MVDDVHEIKDIIDIVENVFSILIRLAGILAFITLIISGFQYLTAGGDAKKAQSARNTITYAILGLVLTILAYFILRFISEFTGVTKVLEFEIPQ